MAKGLDPQVVDIPLLLPNQTPPKHAGPLGRLSSMTNAQIKHFLPSSQQAPQRVEIIARDGFTAQTAECRDSVTGAIVTGDWNNPELLAPIGNQLLSVCDSIPRVNNGASWTYYGSKRVVSNQLSEDVLHTTNHVLGAPDEAYLNGVTCFVWTETSQNGPIVLNTSMVAFRGDDGAWISAPAQLFQNNNGNALAKVVTDGTFFWVIFNTGNKIAINVYDTHGVLVASDATTIPLVWTPTPGYWDVAAFNNAGTHYVLIAQPDSFSGAGVNVDIRFSKCTVAGSVITITTTGAPMGSSNCNGPLNFVDSTATGLPTIASAASGTPGPLWITEWTHAFANSHSYNFGAVLAGSGIPDSLTGWMEPNGAGTIAHVAYSLLSNFSPTAGPPNDPGLRYTRSYACTRAGVVTLTNQVNGVLLSSRAFQIDNDWYAATYYQGGAGLSRTTSSQTLSFPLGTPATVRSVLGAQNQPRKVFGGATEGGAPRVITSLNASIIPTQSMGAIAHNAGDSAVAATATWTFLNSGTFNGPTGNPAVGSLLVVSGSAHATNNTSYRIVNVVSAHVIQTEPIGANGFTMVDDTLAGVTATLTARTIAVFPYSVDGTTTGTLVDGKVVPDGMAGLFAGGTLGIVVAANAANNGTFTIEQVTPYVTGTQTAKLYPFLSPSYGLTTWISLIPIGTQVLEIQTAATMTLAPLAPYEISLPFIGGISFDPLDVGNIVTVASTETNNNGPFPIASFLDSHNILIDSSAGRSTRPAFIVPLTPTVAAITVSLAPGTFPLTFSFADVTFDPSYLGGIITLSGAKHASNNGSYQIIAIISPHTVATVSVTGASGQVNETLENAFGESPAMSVTIIKTFSPQPGYQPCWYLMPLSVAQPVAGRWEWAIAYADWRFDGATKLNQGTFERNGFPCALSSVTAGPTGKQFALPYRAQSFTAGQTVTNSVGGIIGVQSTAESTIGLKLFTLASSPGLAVVNSGEMLLPGAQAGEFSASGFTEDGINLGPEQPYYVTQGVASGALGLTFNASYQYVVVWEVTSENGDRTWSVTSPALDVSLTGSNNSITIGGRMPGPTMRVVGVSIYRTANVGNPPTATIQHYKITNDLAVNGPGFTFSSVNGGAANDTWQFVDSVPDLLILSAETLYTDKGFLQRFPAPANRGGVGSWQNRTWVVGYDGAIWMSGEKDEGDSIWFHPAFRYVLPTDDKPVALASMDNYLLIFCAQSIWFIPSAQFPDATGANGALPTPQPLPFRNGCTGFAITIRDGVVYSSTAGGVWLINRSLINLYLSQPRQDDLGISTINGMALDSTQRLVVSALDGTMYVYDQISQSWQRAALPTSPSLLTSWRGNAVYQDIGRVMAQVPGSTADIIDAAILGINLFGALTLVLGPVKSLKCVWAINLTGQVLGACSIIIQLAYPDESSFPLTQFGPFALTAGPLNLEINPKLEETTTFDLTFAVSFPGVPTPGASLSFELITAEVGIEPTLSKRPNAQRLPGS